MLSHDTSDTIIVIPARMASTRLPGKPMADLCGRPMIVRVWERARQAGLGPVLVAAAEPQIARLIEETGGQAIVTDPDLPSGSDRIAQALALRDPQRRYRFVVNLQGDLPLIAPEAITRCLEPFRLKGVDLTTLAAQIEDENELTDPNVVKAVMGEPDSAGLAIAEDFERQLPASASPPYWHHVGLYAYRRSALERFVSLPVSAREAERKLEQMRALDNGMKIGVACVDTIPFGVDTPDDLERARKVLRAELAQHNKAG